MNRHLFTIMASILLFTLMPAAASADEVAAERARLANQRIQAEEERRAREEAEQRAREEAERRALEAAAQLGDTPNESPGVDVRDDAREVPADRLEMSRALEQLRELGALRDAGYVTAEEFEQLKKRILDGAL